MNVTVAAPRIEHHRDPLGIGEAAPRISWRIAEAPAGWVQTAYRLLIERAAGSSTHEVSVDDQVLVPWPGAPLVSRERAVVRVQIAGADGLWSDPSPARTVEAGLLEPTDWTAR